MRLRVRLALLGLVPVLATWTVALAGDGPSRQELVKAEHYLKKIEREVVRHGGKPFSLSYDSNEALRRVRALKEKYPDADSVEDMFQRVRRAVKASKGDTFQITPKMLAYRENEKKLARTLAGINVAAWEKLHSGLAASGRLIEKPFPSPKPLETDPVTMFGKHVILTEFAYPQNEFTDTGGQYVFAGSPTQGYYFVQLSSRAWVGAYEALKRYRRQASQDIPAKWTVIGKITGVTLLVPQAGEEKTMSAWFGWLVEPVAIYAPGSVLARVDPEHPRGGSFVGEARLEQLKQSMYTFTSVPEDVEPLKLVEIFATAIKEKNWELFLECIDPARKQTIKAVARLRYFYDNNQERYRRFYVHVQPVEVASIIAIRGGAPDEKSDEGFFLDEEDAKDIKKHAPPLVEEARVIVRPFDERGRQFALPHKVVLRRYAKKRWLVYSSFPL